MGIRKRMAAFNLSFFYKLLLSYLIMILSPTIMISYISYHSFSNDLTETMNRAVQNRLQQMSGQMKQLVDNINTFSIQLAMSTDLQSEMKRTKSSMYEYKMIKDDLNKQILSNDLFYSMYLYMQVSDQVMTTNEGIFKRSEFYDKAFINHLIRGEHDGNEISLRTIKDPKPVEVFTFYRNIPPLNSYPLGKLIINVKKNVIIEKLLGDQALTEPIMIYSGQDVIFQSFKKEMDEGYDYLMSHSQGYGKNAEFKIGKKDYAIHSLHLNDMNWTIILFTPYNTYTHQLNNKLFRIVKNDLMVLLAGLFLSYLLSIIMYKPWKKIVVGLSDYFSHTYKPKKNDSLWVADAVTHLINENVNFQETIKQNEPIIRARFIHDILIRNFSPMVSVADKFENMGIAFKYPYFLVMIASSDLGEHEGEGIYDNKLLMFSYIKNKLEQNFAVE